MSLPAEPIFEVPEITADVARAAFPNGNVYLTLRDKLGVIFENDDFADLYPERGQPALSPWRLALITIMQFRENLSDRQAADAVRSRIDWKYLLGLDLSDPGFDFSVLSEFRSRLLASKAEVRLLEKLLEVCHTHKLVKSRGKQRTDSTRVLASIRAMNRLEQVGETVRAALNELATVAPKWLQQVVPAEWYKRYGRRIEADRLPKSESGRVAYGQTVGEDGFLLMDLVTGANAPDGLDALSKMEALALVWERHYEREGEKIRFKAERELAKAALGLESPYDPDARYRSRSGKSWVGYIVHVSETCDDDTPHLITHVETTTANVHEAQCTEKIHQALVDKGIPPDQHLVDAAYVGAELLVSSKRDHGISLIGPGRPDPSWQSKVEAAYDRYDFDVDWERQQVTCPQGKKSMAWRELIDRKTNDNYHLIVFSRKDCAPCPARALCTRAKIAERRIRLQSRAQYEALKEARLLQKSEAGRKLYNKRAGVEGTVSQGVRGFGLRQTRYRGEAKTHLQHIATAAAINIDRIVAWLDGIPLALTRTSRFAALAL